MPEQPKATFAQQARSTDWENQMLLQTQPYLHNSFFKYTLTLACELCITATLLTIVDLQIQELPQQSLLEDTRPSLPSQGGKCSKSWKLRITDSEHLRAFFRSYDFSGVP